jgi:predicted DNA-binding helix-hairpin-helix protein
LGRKFPPPARIHGSFQKLVILADTPDGRGVSLLKVQLTKFSIDDCQYCINRRPGNVRPARFASREVVDLTLGFCKLNVNEWLILSSSIIQSTQMIVGVDGSTYAIILQRASSLYQGYKLRRVDCSRFSPIPETSARLPIQSPSLLHNRHKSRSRPRSQARPPMIYLFSDVL